MISWYTAGEAGTTTTQNRSQALGKRSADFASLADLTVQQVHAKRLVLHGIVENTNYFTPRRPAN